MANDRINEITSQLAQNIVNDILKIVQKDIDLCQKRADALEKLAADWKDQSGIKQQMDYWKAAVITGMVIKEQIVKYGEIK